MNRIATSQKQSSFVKLAGAMLARLSTFSTSRARPRYVNIGEFSPHLQRDMGFVDGHGAPRPESNLNARDLATRDRML